MFGKSGKNTNSSIFFLFGFFQLLSQNYFFMWWAEEKHSKFCSFPLYRFFVAKNKIFLPAHFGVFHSASYILYKSLTSPPFTASFPPLPLPEPVPKRVEVVQSKRCKPLSWSYPADSLVPARPPSDAPYSRSDPPHFEYFSNSI